MDGHHHLLRLKVIETIAAATSISLITMAAALIATSTDPIQMRIPLNWVAFEAISFEIVTVEISIRLIRNGIATIGITHLTIVITIAASQASIAPSLNLIKPTSILTPLIPTRIVLIPTQIVPIQSESLLI